MVMIYDHLQCLKARWNVLDTLLVSVSVFEEIYGLLTIEQGNRLDMTSARVIRLLRWLK